MHIERVTRGIALLRKVHAEGLPFDLRDWFSDPDNAFDCGTAACAVGWMVRDEWMQEQGLDVHREATPCTPVFLESENDKPIWLYGFDAVEAFFDISLNESYNAFSVTRYDNRHVTAADVADRMQGWLDAAKR